MEFKKCTETLSVNFENNNIIISNESGERLFKEEVGKPILIDELMLKLNMLKRER